MLKKIKAVIFIFSCIILTDTCLSQVPVIQWQKSFGGSGAEYGYSILQNPADSCFVFAGSSSSNNGDVPVTQGLDDYVLMKINALGTLLWEHAYGGTDYDVAYSVTKTNDGGYVLCGQASSSDGDVTVNYGDSDYWVVKVSSNGTLQWQRSYGGSQEDNGSYAIQTSDGGYIISGYSTSNDVDVTGNHGLGDYWIVKTNSTGIIQWQKTFGGTSLDYGGTILQTTDGGYIVCGTSKSNDGDVTGNHGLEDYWIVKLSSTGILQWQKSFGGTGNDYGQDIKQTSDGGYIVIGRANSNDGDITDNHGHDDYWVVKITSTGTIQWKKSFGGSLFDIANSIVQTSDGGYLLGGQSNSNDGDKTFSIGTYDNWLVKINSAGTILWQKTFGGSAYENTKSIITTVDGGIAVCGESISNDVDVSGNHGFDDIWIIKLSIPLAIEENNINTPLSFFPNPGKNELTVKTFTANETVAIKIIDVYGKVVSTASAISENNLAKFNVNLENGVYVLKMIFGNGSERTSKLIIEH